MILYREMNDAIYISDFLALNSTSVHVQLDIEG